VIEITALRRAMSADFFAGYLSGAAGILIGNPLDLIKVRLQAGHASSTPSTSALPPAYFSNASSLIRGATAPILGYGALNALLFVTYNRSTSFLTPSQETPDLWTTWIAGAIGGLATWVVSTPTEVVKCQAQMASSPSSSLSRSGINSWGITRQIFRTEGVRGFYQGGVVTALRDSIGYGFYFWSYELFSRFLEAQMKEREMGSNGQEAAKVLLCGGLAGVVTWASVFPLDVIKTRVQTQDLGRGGENAALLGTGVGVERNRLGAVEIARQAYRNEGVGVFFRGLGVCSVRAFVVNAVQWAVYEWIMRELDRKRETVNDRDRPV
jgi:solute carrier family 25 carnitine/acylcarnitine transporter 20/29